MRRSAELRQQQQQQKQITMDPAEQEPWDLWMKRSIEAALQKYQDEFIGDELIPETVHFINERLKEEIGKLREEIIEVRGGLETLRAIVKGEITPIERGRKDGTSG